MKDKTHSQLKPSLSAASTSSGGKKSSKSASRSPSKQKSDSTSGKTKKEKRPYVLNGSYFVCSIAILEIKAVFNSVNFRRVTDQ